MSNPTSAKPTTAVYGSGLTFGTNLQSALCLTEGSGAPSELKTRVVGNPGYGGSNSNGLGFLASGWPLAHSGGPPVWVSNGLTIGATNYGATLKFDHSTRPLFFGTCGFPTAGSNGVTAKTMALVFRHGITSYNRINSSPSYAYPLINSGMGGGMGLGLQTDAISGIPGDKLRLVFTSANTQTDPITPLEILPGRLYAAAVACSVVSGGVNTKTFFLYDLTNGLLHPASGLAMVDSKLGFVPDAGLLLGGYGSASPNPLVGEFGEVSLHNEAWTASDFLNYVADPWSFGRGTYTPSGSLTATQGRQYDATTTTVQVGWGRTIGIGTGGGTGAPAYSVYRAADPTIAPGAGGSTLLSGGLVASNGNTVVLSDTGLSADTDYWYTLRSVDGTQTLDGLPMYAKTYKKAELKVLIIGDSKEEITSVAEFTAAAANADNRRLTMVNMGRGGAGITATNSNSSWQIGAVIPASNQQATLSYKNGSVTGGTFNLIFPFSSPLTASTIAWNTSAASLQTILNSALGSGVVTAAGGPLNTTPITLTGASGSYQNASWPLPVYDLVGSALTGPTATVAGEPVTIGTSLTAIYNPGTTANNLYTIARAEATRVGCTKAVLQNGANDTANSAWTTAVSAMLADLLSGGIAPLVRIPQTRRSANTIPDASGDATFWAFRALILTAAAANPGTKVGTTTAYALSVQGMDPTAWSDSVHEAVGSAFAASIGVTQYNEIVAAFDPAAATFPIVVGS